MEWKERNRPLEGDEGVGRIDVEAPGYSVLRQGGGSGLSDLIRNPLVLVALVLVVALLMGLAVLRMGGGPDLSPYDARITGLESQIAQLQQRLEAIAAQSPAGGDPADLQRQIDGLVKRLDRTEAAMVQRMAALEQSTKPAAASAAAAKAAAPAPAQPAPAATAPKTPAASKDRIYTVKPGDTLYSISRGANLTVGKLRQLNKLAPDAAIHPGDRLKIGP